MSRARLFVFLATTILVAKHLDAATIFWSDSAGQRISRGNTEDGSMQTLFSSANGLVDPRGVAVDAAAGRLYYADAGADVIVRSNLDGSQPATIISTGLVFPSDIEIDSIAGKIYWADRDAGAIRRANLDGSLVENVRTNLTQPYFLELDLQNQVIYWSDFDSPVIHRADLSGAGAVETFVTGLDRVRDIVLDTAGGLIYWNDRDSHTVHRAPLDSPEDFVTLFGPAGLDRPHGLALDPSTSLLYWADTTRQLVMSGRTDGAGSPQILFQIGLQDPWDVDVLIPEPATVWLVLFAAIVICVWRVRIFA